MTDATDAATDGTTVAGITLSQWWVDTWPLGKVEWKRIALAYVAVLAVFTIAGFLLTDILAPNDVVELDRELAQDLEAGRTETRTDLATLSSALSDTWIKIGASVLIAGAMLYAWRRWHEVVFMGLTLIFEASAYVVTSRIVGRPRPDVERLIESPVDTSFPSGHVAAATVYASLAIIVFWRTRSTWARALAVVVTLAIPPIVAWARLYQGMHFLSDVIAGSILGAISVWLVYKIMGAPADAVDSPVSQRRTASAIGGPR